MLRFLTLNLLFFGLVSCALPLSKTLQPKALEDYRIHNPYFSDSEIDYIYKARIEAFNRNYGGILIVKKIEPEHHRVVMTTEFGGKLFDFEFKKGAFIQNSILEVLDKKMVVNVLKRDFELLVSEEAKAIAQFDTDNYRVWQTEKEKRRTNFYFYSDTTERLERIKNTTKTKEKIEIDFYTQQGTIADSVIIRHKNIPILIDLKKI